MSATTAHGHLFRPSFRFSVSVLILRARLQATASKGAVVLLIVRLTHDDNSSRSLAAAGQLLPATPGQRIVVLLVRQGSFGSRERIGGRLTPAGRRLCL